MSAKFLGFWIPFPPCLHASQINSIEFTQPPSLHLHLGDPLPPPSVDVIQVWSLGAAVGGEGEVGCDEGEGHVRHQGVDLAARDLLLRQVEEQHELVPP